MNILTVKNMRAYLQQILRSSGTNQKVIAKQIGISDSYFSKFINGKEIAFWMARKIIQTIDKSNEATLLKLYVSQGIKKSNYAAALEYFYSKQEYNFVEELISLNGDRGPYFLELSNVYRFVLDSRFTYEKLESIERLKQIKTEHIESQIVLEFIHMYTYFLNRNFEITLYRIELIKKLIEQLNDPFLQISFQARIDEVLANIYLKQNKNIKKARIVAKKILARDYSENHNMTAYHTLGLSYFLESYDESLHYYKKMLTLMEKYNDRDSDLVENKMEIAILQYYWGKEIESAYNVNEFTQSLITNEGLVRFYNDPNLRKYAMFLDGMKEKSEKKLLLSIHYFEKDYEKFRATFPKKELMKLDFAYTL
ncbi:hypothetical protein BK049_11610 [Bacillus xiamenensis]|uniref:Uncharacterized protein n=1 Tax=Bacillus xiamenensis TaxID=1178537 RepID=A0AAC9NCW3_9BACI|nr:AimR family lysis-lysogeny pheromone receptor [Bacillus xiamenensis]AOZ89273.1 hypothetical protein BK049_11610 [Bacillus xiamenensis]